MWRRRVAAYRAVKHESDAAFPRPDVGVIARLGRAIWRFGLLGPVPENARATADEAAMPTDLLRLARLVGVIALQRGIETHSGTVVREPQDGAEPDPAFLADPIGALAAGGGAADPGERATGDRARALRVAEAFVELFGDWPDGEPVERASVWPANLDRPAMSSITRSVMAVKGDAARRLFGVSARSIHWAVIDGGIDVGHPAFGAPGSSGPTTSATCATCATCATPRAPTRPARRWRSPRACCRRASRRRRTSTGPCSSPS